MSVSPSAHPVLACAAAIGASVKDVAAIEPVFMTTADKATALLELSSLLGRLEELRLRVLAVSDDVAEHDGSRDPAAWLAHRARLDGGEARGLLRLARALDERRPVVASGLREGSVNRGQAEVLVRALDDLPADVDVDVRARAEEHLVGEAAHFEPRRLRTLGRKVLDVLAPEVGEHHERRLLEREDQLAARRTYLHTRRNGDGTTDVRIRVADVVADRLLTYLEAYTSPRSAGDDRRPYDQRLGAAFGSLLEHVDPRRLPLHGGDATTVLVTLDHDTLREQLAGVGVVGDQPISAGQARRLACTANLVPVVLGGDSEILDQGRARRLYTPAQRKALAVRDVTCRAAGCDIPAAWCEAHHLTPWSNGGRTDLADGVLFCTHHHHRAHDHRYRLVRQANGRIRYHRRT